MIRQILKLNVTSLKGYMYMPEVIDSAILKFNEKLVSGDAVFGGTELESSMAKDTHQILKIFRKDDNVFAEIKLLNVPQGINLRNSSYVFRPSGIGSIENGIIDQYEILTVDALPAHNDSWKEILFETFYSDAHRLLSRRKGNLSYKLYV